MLQTKNKGPFRMVRMAEARDRLPELTATVEKDEHQAVELCRRDAPAALLVSYGRYAELIRVLSRINLGEGSRKGIMAWAVTDEWLGKAPAHLREPQYLELQRLPTKALLALFMANPGRLSTEFLNKSGVDPQTLHRLRKRQAVAKAIQDAEKEGLYDAAEHSTSEVELD